MKKVLFALGLPLLILVCTSGVASAKAPTVKISISGADLTHSIDVTDPRVLAISDVWSGQFFDVSRAPEETAPKDLNYYEISFYVKVDENDVRKMYVAYYYPNSLDQEGFLYLPGKGPVRGLNVGTMIRAGRDGKWNYVSPQWEALIKPLIARAEAAPNSTSAADSPKDEPLAKASKISIDGWTRPQPGWLYVLDPRSEADHPGSRVWLLDPETSKIMGSIRAGYDPDFALSPDGSRLYIASGERDSGELAVMDNATGTVRHIPFPDRVLYKPWYAGLPPFSRMQVSSNGRAFCILVHRLFSPEKAGYQLWTFDTQSDRFLPARLQLGNCGYGDFVPSSTAGQIDFLCPTTNRIRFVQVDATYHQASNTFVELPWPKQFSAAQGFPSANGEKLAIVRDDGAIYQIDTASREFSPTKVGGDPKQFVFPLQWPRSPDGTRAYLGYGQDDDAATGTASARELRVFDTSTWQQLGTIRTSVPFWSAAASKDGRLIYAVAPQQHCVLVIDATTLKELRAINVGTTPATAVVAP